MSKKAVCPYCFHRFDKSEAMFRCGNAARCQQTNDNVLAAFWKEGMMPTGLAIEPKRGLMSRLFGSSDYAECPSCGQKSYIIICPECHNRIPREMMKTGGCIISIVGARSSGKTNYITTLINELYQKGANIADMGILASNLSDDPRFNTQHRYEEDFFNILYRKGSCPPQTDVNDPKSRVPLIYEVSSPSNDPLYLVFYDTAGENFDNANNIAANAQFLQESDAIIFLLDTMAVPEVHDKISPETDVEMKFDRILANLVNYFQDILSEEQKQKLFNKPIALAFSKIDVILNNPDKLPYANGIGLSMEKNSNYLDGSPISTADLDSYSENIEAMLKSKWMEGNFINNIANKFPNHHYFGISALGTAPDAANNVKKIRPYRVLDPLIWILLELGYKLPTTN